MNVWQRNLASLADEHERDGLQAEADSLRVCLVGCLDERNFRWILHHVLWWDGAMIEDHCNEVLSPKERVIHDILT